MRVTSSREPTLPKSQLQTKSQRIWSGNDSYSFVKIMIIEDQKQQINICCGKMALIEPPLVDKKGRNFKIIYPRICKKKKTPKIGCQLFPEVSRQTETLSGWEFKAKSVFCVFDWEETSCHSTLRTTRRPTTQRQRENSLCGDRRTPRQTPVLVFNPKTADMGAHGASPFRLRLGRFPVN